MKININTTTGYLAEKSNINEVKIEGVAANEYPYNERWTDLYAQLEEGPGATSLTYEGFRDTGYFLRFFRHNQNDQIFMKYQMPHSWDPTTAIKPHMHCIPMASGSGTVKFNYVYTWAPVRQAISAGSSWITGSVTASFDPSEQYTHSVIGFGTIEPPADSHESIVFLLKIERPGAADVADTYSTTKDHGTGAANFGVLFFDLHYQQIKAGTVTEYPEVTGSL